MQIALLGGVPFLFARARLWLGCRATGESVLEAHFWMIFRYVTLAGHWGERFGGGFVFWGGCCVDSCSAAGPLGRAFWRCIFGWLLARPKLYHHYRPQGRRSWPQDGSNAAARQPTWSLDGCTCPQPGA